MKISLVGRTELLYDTALLLHKRGHEVASIVTSRSESHYERTEGDFEALAKSFNLPFIISNRFDAGVREMIKSCGTDVVFSVNWPFVLATEDLGCAPLGFVNAHAGDLPRYRGNACPNWAILNGETRLGLTLHMMEASSLDSGPILLKRYFNISEQTYIGDCYRWLRETVPSMFLELASNWQVISSRRLMQEDTGLAPLRCFPRLPSDSRIQWAAATDSILRLVRASSHPFGGATSIYCEETVTIWRASKASIPYDFCAVPGSILTTVGEGVAIASHDGAVAVEEATFADGRNALPEMRKRMRARLS